MTSASPSAPAPAAPATEESIPLRLLRVVWYSIALGIFLEFVALLVAAVASSLPPFATGVADTVQKLLVDARLRALALGSAAAKAVRTAAAGVAGLLTAPAAFIVAKSLHKAVEKALAIPSPPGPEPVSVPSVVVLAVIKALEFAALGAIAAWLTKQDWSDLKTYAILGLTIALIFGGSIVGYTVYASDPALAGPKVVALSLNELLYPIGCALALYAADAFGRRLGEKPSDE